LEEKKTRNSSQKGTYLQRAPGGVEEARLMQAPQSTQLAVGRGSLGSEDLGAIATGAGASRARQQLLQVSGEGSSMQSPRRLCGHKAGDRGRLATTPHRISRLFHRTVNSAPPPCATCTDSGSQTHLQAQWIRGACSASTSATIPQVFLTPSIHRILAHWKRQQRATMLERPEKCRRASNYAGAPSETKAEV
jgi:hypothetical protein